MKEEVPLVPPLPIIRQGNLFKIKKSFSLKIPQRCEVICLIIYI